MEGKEAYPKWLIETKKTVGKAKEWKNFIAALQGAVDQHLKENHVPSFADLAPAERILFVDRASRSLQTGSNYDQLYNATSHLLDQQVNNTVAKEMLSDSSAVGVAKPELINEHLKDGVVSILKRWPEMKVKFHMCLNIPVPTKLRTNAWTLFMSDPRARKDYVEKLMKEPKKAISDQDQLISQTCENMLRIQNTFSDIGPPTVGSFFAMKAVLSYFHAQQNDTEELHHVYYLLILPMLHTLSPHISKTKPAANNVVMILVEMYLTFIRDRPKYVCDIKNEHRTELKSFSDKVAEHLAAYEKSTQGNLATFIACLSQTGQRFLNKDTLMYIWDQQTTFSDVKM
ncbi:hypothetical protein EB796_004544 [Bugula neritina]|uniref:Uncharacterized protein n=1 Tax=Bugula neritina TaxID=10212 RepID=A0A7J7KI45_BUGNE|nr:hypothetical protein EB796_004544 [Bugula neritina]